MVSSTLLSLRSQAGSVSHRVAPATYLAIMVSTLLFIALAVLVWANISWLKAADHAVAYGVTETHSEALNVVMRGVTLLGNRWIIGGLLLAVSYWVERTGRCRAPLAVMIGAFLVNPVVEASLKGLVGRDRPDVLRLVNGAGPAFPSGHVLATVGFYGLLAVIVARSTTRRSVAIGSLSGAALVIGLVGFSRVYLGVHWLSDVLGAFLVGAVFVLAVTLLARSHHLGPIDSCANDRIDSRQCLRPRIVTPRRPKPAP